jgi:hypothetical protein
MPRLTSGVGFCDRGWARIRAPALTRRSPGTERASHRAGTSGGCSPAGRGTRGLGRPYRGPPPGASSRSPVDTLSAETLPRLRHLQGATSLPSERCSAVWGCRLAAAAYAVDICQARLREVQWLHYQQRFARAVPPARSHITALRLVFC